MGRGKIDHLRQSQEPASIGIYIHIPYCKTLCPYCDFIKHRTSSGTPGVFIDAVCAEIETFAIPHDITSVFFGGGTPSLLAPDDLQRILDAMRRRFRLLEPEITLEANPDDVTDTLVDAWVEAGVNRVSLGIQSFDDACLRYLGRRHDSGSARRACRKIAHHFRNWSLDLIFGAPPVEAWARTLEEAVGLNPPHISAYGLTYEPGTPFEKRAREAVDDERSLAMYHEARAMLRGYDHYEISNFAKPGFQCRHNLIYWRNEEYLGFGPGAYSFLQGVRSRNCPDVDAYLSQPGVKQEALQLTLPERKLETLIQYLRLREGLPVQSYRARFGGDVVEDFGAQLGHLVARGLVERAGDTYRPTVLGYDLNNEIGLALVS